MPRCVVCHAPEAPFGVAWPGLKESVPQAAKGKRSRLCALYGRCHARTVLRAEALTGQRWPHPLTDPPEFRAAVQDLRDKETADA